MSEITVRPMEPRHFAVEVREGHETTNHRVEVPEDLALDLGVAGTDEERLVREAFGFLLEREPATAIRTEFRLDEIADFFPDFADELRRRVT